MIQPSFREVFEALDNWKNLKGYADTDGFEKFVGVNTAKLLYLVHEGEVTEELSKRIQLLIGPHHQTMIKAWMAQRYS